MSISVVNDFVHLFEELLNAIYFEVPLFQRVFCLTVRSNSLSDRVLQHYVELIQRFQNLPQECQQTFLAHEALLFVHFSGYPGVRHRNQHAVQEVFPRMNMFRQCLPTKRQYQSVTYRMLRQINSWKRPSFPSVCLTLLISSIRWQQHRQTAESSCLATGGSGVVDP